MKHEKIIIGIVDDHQIVIDGLQSLLKGRENLQVAFATIYPKEVMELIASNPINILLTDIMMPDLPGNELAKAVRQQFPAVRILALSMNNEGSIVNELIEKESIEGYVLKNIGQPELLQAIEKIAAGGIYFSEAVKQEMQRSAQLKKQSGQVHLTDRELEITRLIEKEYNNRQIAEALFISERTVETHRKNILRKTNTNSVIGLVKFAYEHKLI